MIKAALGYPRGKFADVVADPFGWTIALQDEADGAIVLVQLDPEGERRVPDVRLDGGGGNAFPVLIVDRGATWLAYRHGLTLYGVLRNLTDGLDFALGVVHGNSPIAFGAGFVAWQADATYTIQAYDLRSPGVVIRGLGNGRPTGLGLVRADGRVDLVDDLRFSVRGMLNPRRIGRVVVGENADGPDRNIARLDDGREAQLWPGLTSNTPRIATDGGSYAVATWGGPGVRLAILSDPPDFRPAVAATPTPVGTPVSSPKALAYWFADGRYGAFSPAQNAIVIGSGMWEDGTGQKPADVDARLAAAITRIGRAFLAASDIGQPGIDWSKVLGVFVHEPGTPNDTRQAVAIARDLLAQHQRPARPVIAVLTADRIGDTGYQSTADALAFEIYLAAPAADWGDQIAAAHARIADAIEAVNPTPVYLVVQAYDRSDPAWQARPDALEALQAAANAWLAHSKVLGLWWFAYGRPGGVVTYPKLEAWHAAQVAVTPAPPLPSAPPVPVPPTKPEKPMIEVSEAKARAGYPVPSNWIEGALTRYRNEVLLDRDKIAPDSMSLGALRVFLQYYGATMSGLLVERGVPGGDGWGELSVRAFDAASAEYRRITADPQ